MTEHFNTYLVHKIERNPVYFIMEHPMLVCTVKTFAVLIMCQIDDLLDFYISLHYLLTSKSIQSSTYLICIPIIYV